MDRSVEFGKEERSLRGPEMKRGKRRGGCLGVLTDAGEEGRWKACEWKEANVGAVQGEDGEVFRRLLQRLGQRKTTDASDSPCRPNKSRGREGFLHLQVPTNVETMLWMSVCM